MRVPSLEAPIPERIGQQVVDPGPGRIDVRHDRPRREWGLAFLGREEPHPLETLESDQNADLRALGEGLIPAQYRQRVRELRPLEGRLEELHDGRELVGFLAPEPDDPHPRFTQAEPSEPWKTAPAPPSETKMTAPGTLAAAGRVATV